MQQSDVVSEMDEIEGRDFAGYAGAALACFVAGMRDGRWLGERGRPCWPSGYATKWSPYDDGRMHGWFNARR